MLDTEMEPTSNDAVDAVVSTSRRATDFPLRYSFIQAPDRTGGGPLSSLVNARDKRALLLYLLTITKASKEPWEVTLPATAWARILDFPLPKSRSALTSISKAWRRLETFQLIQRSRKNRSVSINLLREDGTGNPYALPKPRDRADDRYFSVPLTLWTAEDPQGERWYRSLKLPELMVLLIGRSLGDEFLLPRRQGAEWYGTSPATLERGIDGLRAHDLLEVDKRNKKAPLSANGYTTETRYTLRPPFGPTGYISGSASRTRVNP